MDVSSSTFSTPDQQGYVRVSEAVSGNGRNLPARNARRSGCTWRSSAEPCRPHTTTSGVCNKEKGAEKYRIGAIMGSLDVSDKRLYNKQHAAKESASKKKLNSWLSIASEANLLAQRIGANEIAQIIQQHLLYFSLHFVFVVLSSTSAFSYPSFIVLSLFPWFLSV